MLQGTGAVGAAPGGGQEHKEKLDDFDDLFASADALAQSVAQLPLQNAPQVPVLKDAEKALDKERWKDLRGRTIGCAARIAGKIEQFKVFNSLDSLATVVGERTSPQLSPTWKDCEELQLEAGNIIVELEEVQTTLKNQLKFWQEESQAVQQMWNGGQDLKWRIAAMVSKIRHGISYHYAKIQNNVQRQWQALQMQENDVAFARGQLQSQRETGQLLQNVGKLFSIFENMQAFQKELYKQQAKSEGFNSLEEMGRLLKQEIEAFPKDFKLQHQALITKQEEMAASTCFFLHDPKLKADKGALKNFEKHFNTLNRLLGQFATLREKLNILNNIYYYQPYPQEAHVDYQREKEKFDEFKQEKEKLTPLDLETYKDYPIQVTSLKSKQTALALFISQVQTNLEALKKQSAPPVEDQDPALRLFTVNLFIDARSEMRQKATNLMDKIVALNEEFKTGISRKESFLALYFRFEPLQDEIERFEKEKTPYLKSLEDNVKEIQNRLASVTELTQQLKKSALKDLNIYKPLEENKKEAEGKKVEQKKIE